MTISRWILLRTRNVLARNCRENQNTHFMFKYFFFLWKSYRLRDHVRRIWWTQRGRRQHNASAVQCWISKATCAKAHARATTHTHGHKHTHKHARAHIHTHTHAQIHTHACTNTHTQKYVILNAFPRPQWLHERASILRTLPLLLNVELGGK